MLRVYFSAKYSGIPVHGGTVINAVPSICSDDADDYIGKSAHASTPEKGENAITKFLSIQGNLHPLLDKLSELFPHGELNGKSCGLGFSDPGLRQMTCVLTMLNVENCSLCGAIDIRFP